MKHRTPTFMPDSSHRWGVWAIARAACSIAPLLCVGCTSYTLAAPTEAPITAFGPATSKAATVCVIRPSHWSLTTTFVVHDDGQLVGATQGESYFCYFAEGGPHRIVASNGSDQATEDFGQIAFHAESGRRYWLHLTFDRDFGTQLEWLDEERARAYVQRCDYKELVDAPSGEIMPEGIPFARALESGRRGMLE
jgi:hypothetical protein